MNEIKWECLVLEIPCSRLCFLTGDSDSTPYDYSVERRWGGLTNAAHCSWLYFIKVKDN